MITETDALNTLEFGNYFVILPSMKLWDVERFMEAFEGKRCEFGFRYSSGTNSDWLEVDQLRELIRKEVDRDLTDPKEIKKTTASADQGSAVVLPPVVESEISRD